MRIKQRKVLVFPAGTENAAEIWRSLRHCKEFLLFGASSSHDNLGPLMFQDHEVVPDVRSSDWRENTKQSDRKMEN